MENTKNIKVSELTDKLLVIRGLMANADRMVGEFADMVGHDDHGLNVGEILQKVTTAREEVEDAVFRSIEYNAYMSKFETI